MKDRDQLWAEAAAREAKGTSIRLDPKLWSLAERQQEWRLTPDPWHQLLSDNLGEYERAKISTESIWTILDLKPAQRGQEQSRRVGEAMRKLGWDRPNAAGNVRIDGKLISGYVIGRKPWRTVEASRDEDGLYVTFGRGEDEDDRPGTGTGAAGCRKVFSEQASAVGERAQLEAALDYCREDDTLVVTKLDRLARSARHLSDLVDRLEGKGVTLRILNFGGDAVDTRGATGRLMLNMFAAMAQFEREMMLERQREGIARAKAEGKYKGRKPTARAKAQDALRLFREGKKVAHIAKELGIGRGSVYRAIADTATT